MASQIELSIVTPDARLASVTVDELRAPGAVGSFGVRPGHTPFLTRMEPGELWYRQGTTTASVAVSSGFIEVDRDRVSVLAEEALPADKIDVEAARKALAEAQAKMKGMNTAEPAFAVEQARARWAQARLLVAGSKG